MFSNASKYAKHVKVCGGFYIVSQYNTTPKSLAAFAYILHLADIHSWMCGSYNNKTDMLCANNGIVLKIVSSGIYAVTNLEKIRNVWRRSYEYICSDNRPRLFIKMKKKKLSSLITITVILKSFCESIWASPSMNSAT